MNQYQIREKSYTEALASARVGGNLANSLVKTMPNMTPQVATAVDNTFDLAYFQRLASKRESRNLNYIEEKVNRYYGR